MEPGQNGGTGGSAEAGSARRPVREGGGRVEQAPALGTLEVAVVDDDEGVRTAIEQLLSSVGVKVRTYEHALRFLEAVDWNRLGCLVVDVRLPGMSGLQLHRHVRREGHRPPVIVLTAHADTRMVVEEMKAGAFDFMDKPFRAEVLIESVQEALRQESERRRERVARDDVRRRLDSLSKRERELLERLVEGQSVKEIGFDLGISETTVHFHQRNLFEKMDVENPVQLTRLLDRYEFGRLDAAGGFLAAVTGSGGIHGGG